MRPSLRLPEGTIVDDVAEASRVAVETFLAIGPGDKHALSRWLIGPYRHATSFAPRRLHVPTRDRLHASLAVGELVTHAQAALRDAIEAASEPGAERLLAALPNVVDVIPVHDAYGCHGFAPMDVAHRRLSDRVSTLLLADWLTRPDDFVARRGPARRASGPMLALA